MYFASLGSLLLILLETCDFLLNDTLASTSATWASVKNQAPFKFSVVLDRRILNGQDLLLKYNQLCRCFCQFMGFSFDSVRENSAQHSRCRHTILCCQNDGLFFLLTSKVCFVFWLLMSSELILIKKYLKPNSSESLIPCDDNFACLPHFTPIYLVFLSAGL